MQTLIGMELANNIAAAMIGMELSNNINVAAAHTVLAQLDIAIERMKSEVDSIHIAQGVKASEPARADLDTFRMSAHFLRAVIGG